MAAIGRNELGNKRVIHADRRPNKYLLSGLARSGLCGAALIAHKMSLGSSGKRKLVSHCVCSWNNKRGNTICSNNWRKRQDELDEKVLAMIEREVLTPERVQQALRKAKADAKERARTDPDAKKKLEAQIRDLTRERDNIYALSKQKLDDPKRVTDDLNECSRRIKALEAELANLREDEGDPRKFAEGPERAPQVHPDPAGWAEGLRHRPKFLHSWPRSSGVPTGIRTPVTAVKGRCPRPLDDGDSKQEPSRVWWR